MLKYSIVLPFLSDYWTSLLMADGGAGIAMQATLQLYSTKYNNKRKVGDQHE